MIRLAALALVLVACGGSVVAPTPPPRAGAAWDETHRLIDLFDGARVRRDAAARQELLAALGITDSTGDDGAAARTTDAVLDALLVRVDDLLAADRLDAGAGAARTLLSLDRHPSTTRAELLARMTAWKSIARGGGPLAGNALVRLFTFCDAVFRDAAEAAPRDRPLVLATCLYPLYDSDPEPYFDADPTRRAPGPAWADLRARMDELAGTLAGAPGATAALAAPLRTSFDAFVDDAAAHDHLPRPLDPRAMAVPLLGDPPLATPYDGEPLVFVHAPTAAELAAFEQGLRGLLSVDGRGRAALALRPEAPARGLLDLAEALRRLGATTVEIAVGWEQTVRPPAGDYWAGRTTVPRLGVLPLALSVDKLGPRAGLGLVLSVGPRAWRVVGRAGAMPVIPVTDDAGTARAALRAQLALLLDAFPDEGAMGVSPDPSVTAGALTAAVSAALRRADGSVLVAELALAPPPLAQGVGTADGLEGRARRRSAARVTLVPDALAGKTAAVRRCFQDAVERAPGLAGELALELDGAGKARVATGPGDAGLRACVLDRLGPAMIAGRIRTARVVLIK